VKKERSKVTELEEREIESKLFSDGKVADNNDNEKNKQITKA